MAYIKQDWKDLPDKSTPITATRLNHIEDGIANSATTEEMNLVDKNITKLFDGMINTEQTYRYDDNANYLDYRFLFIVQEVTKVAGIVPVKYIESIEKLFSLKGIDNDNNVIITEFQFTENGFICSKCGFILASNNTYRDYSYQVKIYGIK